LIANHYHQTVRYTTAIRAGTPVAESVLRRLTRNNIQHPTWRGLGRFGHRDVSGYAQVCVAPYDGSMMVPQRPFAPTTSTASRRAFESLLPAEWVWRGQEADDYEIVGPVK
jgi:Tn3 transposase DDE domain